MGILRFYRRRLGTVLFLFAFLMPGARIATAQVNPDVQNHVMHGVVSAVRQVKAYANALGASENMWGDIQCIARNDTLTLKQSSIFRVKTASHYYDLSKVCGMEGDFRWPRDARSFPADKLDTWKHWEQLKIGDHVALLRKMASVQLSAPRCQRLGYLSKSFNPLSMELRRGAMRVYDSHCIYKVPIMHVRIRYSTTAAATNGARGTIQQTWDFRVVGSGPLPTAKTAPIGEKYSASLRPAW